MVVVGAIGLALLLWRPMAIGLSVVAVGLAVLVGASQMTASTPPIRDASGRVVPGSISEMGTVNLGGVDQWIMIRGRSTSNPVLLYLAGGPGGSSFSLNRQFNSALEDHFVVVNWEQRGSGKSAGALFADWGNARPQQYAADGVMLTNYLRQRFHQDKIYLWGQSWGTMLGVWMISHLHLNSHLAGAPQMKWTK